MSYLSPTMSLLISAVKKGSQSLIRDFNEIERLQGSVRGPTDFAGSAYGRCERNIRQELSRVKPTYAFALDDQPEPQGIHFVICPLDGIENFIHAIPQFAVSVALVDKGVTLMSLVYNPISDELFLAEKGCGAFKEGFRNHERLRVSGRKDINTALISSTLAFHQESEDALSLITKIFQTTGSLRVSGSLSLDLAYVASGRLDATLSLNAKPSFATAGMLLVKEAGGLVRGLRQSDPLVENVSEAMITGDIFAANSNLSAAVYSLVN